MFLCLPCKNNHLSQSFPSCQGRPSPLAQLQVLGHLKPFLTYCSPGVCLWFCSSTVLLLSVFSGFQTQVPVPSVARVRQVRNQSLQWPPDKLKYHTYGPLVCFLLWGSPCWRGIPGCSALCCTGKGQGWIWQMLCIFLPFCWIPSWFYNDLGAVASWLVFRVLIEVFYSVYC